MFPCTRLPRRFGVSRVTCSQCQVGLACDVINQVGESASQLFHDALMRSVSMMVTAVACTIAKQAVALQSGAWRRQN